MTLSFSHLYNAVILPLTPVASGTGQRFQVSASRGDRGVPRMISPAWSEAQLRTAFAGIGTSTLEFEELLRGNRRAAGGREARRLLFTADQLAAMGLAPELPKAETIVAKNGSQES